MKVSPELLAKIKQSVNLIDVISEHVVLRKSGSNHTGLCPFHSERSPSFSASEQKQLYHCYGCKKGGDLVSFMMEINALSFREAIEELAARARVELPKDWAGAGATAGERSKAQEKLALAHKLNRFVAAFYHQQLPRNAEISAYFGDRGVTEELRRAFYLGAAPNAWDDLTKHLLAKKAPIELATELGLIRPSQKSGPPGGPGFFDLFRHRAIFPIMDHRGRVAGFGARTLGDEKPKYLNSPESSVFQKSKLAYGLYQAQKHIREQDEVVLVEGYFDVLRLHAAGFQNVVATCGTALTPDHLSLFKKLCSKVIILFDGDRAGIAATERAMEVGLDQGTILYGAAVPDEMDPDEFVAQEGGAERLRELLKAAPPILDARIEEEVQAALDQEGSEARVQALKKVGGWLSRFRDPVGKEVRVDALQKRLGLSRQLVLQAMGQASGPLAGRKAQGARTEVVAQQPSRPGPASGRPRGSAKLSDREKVLLIALARGEQARLFAEAREHLPGEMTFSDLFDYFPARAFVASLAQESGEPRPISDADLAGMEGELDLQVRSIVAEGLVSERARPSEEEIRLALARGMARLWARFSQQIKTRLADAEAKKDAGLQALLMKEYLDVQRRMKEFNSFYEEA